jgi:cell wall-associated NlpC family hydrolase
MKIPNPIRWIREWGEAEEQTNHHTLTVKPCVFTGCQELGVPYRWGDNTTVEALCPKHRKKLGLDKKDRV